MRNVQLPSYTSEEVAKHNKDSDCWVIVHGAVCNVTDFLPRHPGGVSALSKIGRAGRDVTEHFERIGHSANARQLMKSFQIGVLDESSEFDDDGNSEASRLLSESNNPRNSSVMREMEEAEVKSELKSEHERDKEHSIHWHAARRNAIMRDHPEVAALIGSNPWTCVLGLLTVFVHCYTCIVASHDSCPWYMSLFLGYTVGAVCKMYQFAINHDICHGTAGAFLERSDILKRTAMQLFTLPAFGGTMHTYYEFQHVGHHTSLGSQSLADTLSAGQLQVIPGKSKQIMFQLERIRKIIFFSDGDGDMLAVGTLSLGRILLSWDPLEYLGQRKPSESALFHQESPVEKFHRLKWIKLVSVQIGHLLHHAMMMQIFLFGLFFPPFLSLPVFLFPDKAVELLYYLKKRHEDAKRAAELKQQEQEQLEQGRIRLDAVLESGTFGTSEPSAGVTAAATATEEQQQQTQEQPPIPPETMDVILRTFTRLTASLSLHTWAWVCLDAWLLFWQAQGWTLGSVLKGLCYLYLSELCLYGFALHPFMGYFLGVHRSGGKGFERKAAPAAVRPPLPSLFSTRNSNANSYGRLGATSGSISNRTHGSNFSGFGDDHASSNINSSNSNRRAAAADTGATAYPPRDDGRHPADIHPPNRLAVAAHVGVAVPGRLAALLAGTGLVLRLGAQRPVLPLPVGAVSVRLRAAPVYGLLPRRAPQWGQGFREEGGTGTGGSAPTTAVAV
jgi:hypothetical protein